MSYLSDRCKSLRYGIADLAFIYGRLCKLVTSICYMSTPNPQGLLISSPLRPEHTCSMRQYLFSVPQHAYINLTSSPPLIIPYQDLMLQHHYNHQRVIPNLPYTQGNIPL